MDQVQPATGKHSLRVARIPSVSRAAPPVFGWPSSGTAPVNEKASVHQGYNLIRWTNAGMTYWVVSDLNLAELQQFAQLLQGESQAVNEPYYS